MCSKDQFGDYLFKRSQLYVDLDCQQTLRLNRCKKTRVSLSVSPFYLQTNVFCSVSSKVQLQRISKSTNWAFIERKNLNNVPHIKHQINDPFRCRNAHWCKKKKCKLTKANFTWTRITINCIQSLQRQSIKLKLMLPINKILKNISMKLQPMSERVFLFYLFCHLWLPNPFSFVFHFKGTWTTEPIKSLKDLIGVDPWHLASLESR
jgi:hypothetical protein